MGFPIRKNPVFFLDAPPSQIPQPSCESWNLNVLVCTYSPCILRVAGGCVCPLNQNAVNAISQPPFWSLSSLILQQYGYYQDIVLLPCRPQW